MQTATYANKTVVCKYMQILNTEHTKKYWLTFSPSDGMKAARGWVLCVTVKCVIESSL